MIEVGIDIGGTFTDVVCLMDRTRLHSVKVPTSVDLISAVIEGVRQVLAQAGAAGARVERVVHIHGTTVATNAVLEGRGAVTASLTTEGFEDVLEIGRQKRSRMYDFFMDPETPAFLSPRRMRRGIRERLDGQGQVLVPLDEAGVVQTVRELRDRFGIQSVAVCYLNAYQNPVHELRTREVIAQEFPDLSVSLSCEVNPIFREYERTCTTVFDAYVRPIVERYLERLAAGLGHAGAGGELQIMQSRGGIGSARMAARRPVSTLLSGPAAGVVGGRFAGGLSAHTNLITMDIGGTSCDVSLVKDGVVQLTKEGRLRGYPLRLPTVDIVTIGSGGGSLAWLDDAGGLHVGPRSAGAVPGPACYARGGTEPAVTDASVVLGYIDPGYFAGGTLRLDAALAAGAVRRLAERLGLALPDMALGIHRIVNAQMAEAVRLVTVNRGYDPRKFAMIAFGGAGPVHAPLVARQLQIPTVIVPGHPGTLSAFGLLVADLEYDAVRAFQAAADAVDPDRLESQFAAVEATSQQRLMAEGLPAGDFQVRRSVEMRYRGQSFELEIPMEAPASREAVARVVTAFHRRHEEVFGHADPARLVEFVTIRTVHSQALREPRLGGAPTAGSPVDAVKGRRGAFFESVSAVEVTVYDRARLAAGSHLEGPCIVEQPDTTTVIYPGQYATCDVAGNLLVHVVG
jgi:N-methylhydantoinase A